MTPGQIDPLCRHAVSQLVGAVRGAGALEVRHINQHEEGGARPHGATSTPHALASSSASAISP